VGWEGKYAQGHYIVAEPIIVSQAYTGFRSPVLQVSGQMFSGHRVAYSSHHIMFWPLKLSKL